MSKMHAAERKMSHGEGHAFSHSEATDRGLTPAQPEHEADIKADIPSLTADAKAMMTAHAKHKFHHDGGLLKHGKA